MTYVEDIVIVELSLIDVSITEVAIVTSSVLTFSKDDGSNNDDVPTVVSEENKREVVATFDIKVDVESTVVSEENGSDDNIKVLIMVVVVGFNNLVDSGIYFEKIFSVITREDDSEVLMIVANDDVVVVVIEEDGSGVLMIIACDEVVLALIEEDGSRSDNVEDSEVLI